MPSKNNTSNESLPFSNTCFDKLTKLEKIKRLIAVII
jgi:hypothetical protein